MMIPGKPFCGSAFSNFLSRIPGRPHAGPGGSCRGRCAACRRILVPPPVEPAPGPQPAAKSFEGLPEKTPVSRLPSSQSLLLPPLPGASDVTRRIENGLPRRGPAGTPSVKQPPAKHQTAQTPIARTPPVKLRAAVTNPSPGRKKARRPRIAVVIDDMGSNRIN
jgi:hypothetical protein